MIAAFTICKQPIPAWSRLSAAFGILLLITGCVQPYKKTLPPDLANQLHDSLSFAQIKAFPDEHKGKLIILGGQILSAKRLIDSTELVILHLPLIQEREPATDLTHSQGRFIAYQQTFLDPATVPPGTRITLVGELSGTVIQKLDETDYTYPTLTIKQLKTWPAQADYPRYQPYPFWGPYPYAYPFWGPRGRFYGHYPYWYW